MQGTYFEVYIGYSGCLVTGITKQKHAKFAKVDIDFRISFCSRVLCQTTFMCRGRPWVRIGVTQDPSLQDVVEKQNLVETLNNAYIIANPTRFR